MADADLTQLEVKMRDLKASPTIEGVEAMIDALLADNVPRQRRNRLGIELHGIMEDMADAATDKHRFRATANRLLEGIFGIKPLTRP